MNRHIDAICCDVDGTLYSIRRMIRDNLRSILPVRRVFRDLHKVRDDLRLRESPTEDFRELQAERYAQRLGISPEEAAREIRETIEVRWMDLFRQGRVAPYPGMAECLRSLKEAGLKLAVLSDYPLGDKLAGLGLEPNDFAVSLNAEESGALKPHGLPFAMVAEKLELPPERILYVGDREALDVEGALRAGMRAARVYRRRRPQTRADFAFRRWRLLPRLLRWKGML